MSEMFIGIALLVALLFLVPVMVIARRAGAIPGRKRIDRSDGTSPAFVDGGGSSDCSGADGGGSCD